MRRMIIGGVVAATITGTVLGGSSCATTRETNEQPKVRVADSEPWRDQRPASGTPAPPAFPAYQRAELKNGLTVIVLEDHAQPTVHATLIVRAGTVSDGKDAGLAALTWDLLDEGAGDQGAAALAGAFGDIGAHVDAGAARDYGHLEVRVLRPSLERALELMGLLAQKPTFAAGDFERVRKRHIAHISIDASTPEAIADEVMLAEVFGADHPYGHHSAGTRATLEKLKPQAAKKFWTDHAGPKNAVLVLVGDITPDEGKALADKHLGKWRGGPAKGPKAPAAPKARKQARLVAVDFPGAPQTIVRVARAVTSSSDPDLAAALAVNQVLGGMPASRLGTKLRDEKQFTASVSSSVEARPGPGPFVIKTDVEADKTGEALAEIVAQLDTLKTGGVTDEELALAKASYTRALPGLFALPDLVVADAALSFAGALPADHQQKLADAVDAVTAEQAKAAAERLISRDDLVIVLVGDRATIEAAVAAKALGDLVFVGRDGQPIK